VLNNEWPHAAMDEDIWENMTYRTVGSHDARHYSLEAPDMGGYNVLTRMN